MNRRIGQNFGSAKGFLWHQTLRMAVLLSCAVVASAAPSALVDTNDYFSSLKQFLNTNLDQFEIVFSRIHHSNPMMVDLSKYLASNNMSTTLDTPEFTRVRLASDGFFAHRALSLTNIQDQTVPTTTEFITGFYSNTDWSSHMHMFDLDKAQALEKSARLGPDWWKRSAHAYTGGVLELGLRGAKSGTFEWNGTNFTAIAGESGMVPSQIRGKRVISGGLSFASGKPYAFSYTVGTNPTIY